MIPVFEPDIGESEIELVVDALKKGEISGSFGNYIPQFEQQFAKFVGTKFGIACTSGTTALHLAIAAVGIKRGDEVLISSSTNIATALAVVHNGGIPVPVDSENETWNLDLDLIEKLITPRTKAIIPVHLFGHPVDMPKLMEIANRHKIIVIEDCAESHGATAHGKMTGSFGQISCFSFYANKIITTGEGGMVMTDDPVIGEKVRLLRNLGFTKPRFRHNVLAYNFRMTGFQAAMGVAQLAKIDRFVEQKRWLAAQYNRRLKEIPGIITPPEKAWAKNVYWMYGIVLTKEFGISRDDLMARLTEKGIETRTFFCPMNLQPALQELPGFRNQSNPVAEKLWEQGLYLPSSTKLDEAAVNTIVEAIRSCARN